MSKDKIKFLKKKGVLQPCNADMPKCTVAFPERQFEFCNCVIGTCLNKKYP